MKEIVKMVDSYILKNISEVKTFQDFQELIKNVYFIYYE